MWGVTGAENRLETAYSEGNRGDGSSRSDPGPSTRHPAENWQERPLLLARCLQCRCIAIPACTAHPGPPNSSAGIVVGSRMRGRSRDARPGVSSLLPLPVNPKKRQTLVDHDLRTSSNLLALWTYRCRSRCRSCCSSAALYEADQPPLRPTQRWPGTPRLRLSILIPAWRPLSPHSMWKLRPAHHPRRPSQADRCALPHSGSRWLRS